MEAARPAQGGSLDVRVALPAEHAPLAGMINEFYGAHEGFAPLNEKLWEWHKVNRPGGMGADLVVAEVGGEVAATCTWAETSLFLHGDDLAVASLADFAYRAELCDGGDALRSLLVSAPQGTVVCLIDKEDSLSELYLDAGFEKAVSEVSMMLPFSDSAHEAMAAQPGPWYVMVESVIGM
jgi:hypothetical protein